VFNFTTGALPNPTAPNHQHTRSSTTSAAIVADDAPFNFSACLIVKDASQRLPEWLAYHYTVLPLRRLIVGVDPFSLTQPDLIVDAYQSIGLQTTIWHERHYLPENQRVNTSANMTGMEKYRFYLRRQVAFYSQCTKQLKGEKKSWVILIDADEFLTYNYLDDSDLNALPRGCCWNISQAERNATREGCSANTPEESQQCIKNHPRQFLPPIGSANGTLAHTIAALFRKGIPDWYLRYCIVAPRRNIKSLPSPIPSSHQQPLNESKFATLHFRLYDNQYLLGKSILDVSRYNAFRLRVHNPHNVLRTRCMSSNTPEETESLFLVHHYPGFLEYWLASGKSREAFESINNFTPAGESWHMKGWLARFVELVGGEEKAHELTERLMQWAKEQDDAVSVRLQP
jgi:hypothetical protein